MKRSGLYAITPDWADSDRLLEACSRVLAEQPAALQLRRKSADRDRLREEARALARLCRTARVPFIVNDDIDLALLVEADGVHLGRTDGTVDEARRVLGPGRLIGVSCYGDPERARRAEQEGADYVAVGSIYPSLTKPGAPVAGLAAVIALRAATYLPLVAIGGITRDNLGPVREAGADMAAIIHDLFETGDPGERAREIARLWRAENVCKE